MNKDRELNQRVKDAFDRQSLDSDTREKLRQARAAALQQTSGSRTPRWLPATAVAGLVLVVAAILFNRVDQSIELPILAADEIAVVGSDDELEMYEELEFYIWLDGEEPA